MPKLATLVALSVAMLALPTPPVVPQTEDHVAPKVRIAPADLPSDEAEAVNLYARALEELSNVVYGRVIRSCSSAAT